MTAGLGEVDVLQLRMGTPGQQLQQKLSFWGFLGKSAKGHTN